MKRHFIIMAPLMILAIVAGLAGAAGAVVDEGYAGETVTATQSPNVPTATTTTATLAPMPAPTVNDTAGPNASVDLTNQGSPRAARVEGITSFTVLDEDANATRPEIALELLADGFTAPMQVASPDDASDRLFVVDQVGTVHLIDQNGTLQTEPFLDLRDEIVPLNPGYDERGLFSIAFHPNFRENGKVYAYYSVPLRSGGPDGYNHTNRLSEFVVMPDDQSRVDEASERILLEIDLPYMNHNGGMIAFSPANGYLYIPTGDGGGANDTGFGHTSGLGNAQDLTTLLGKVLRIDVDNATGANGNVSGDAAGSIAGNETAMPYSIPAGNPFVGIADVRPEIYAYGFRNPAFAVFDSNGNHSYIVASAGQALFESVYVVTRGGNYGWNIREGTHCFDPANNRVPPGTCPTTGADGKPLIGPVFEGGHDLGNTVVGGKVYRGTAIPDLTGRYLFGYWSTSFGEGDGTLLVATPSEAYGENVTRASSDQLEPADVEMWTTQELFVNGSSDGRLDAYFRGIFGDWENQLYLLANDEPGPDSATHTGRVYRIVAPGQANATPTPATTATTAPAVTGTPTLTATVSPTTTATTEVPSPTATPANGGATIDLVAQGIAFDQDTLTVAAGSTVTVNFDNRDEGIPHNVAVYTDSSATQVIFQGETITGPATTTYTFAAPDQPGEYFFRCDIHPATMTGRFVVE